MARTTRQPRSPIEIERDITRCAARLRELRAAQAATPSRDRPRYTRDIGATSSRLDRLFEEKRASRLAARVFGELGNELVERSSVGVAP